MLDENLVRVVALASDDSRRAPVIVVQAVENWERDDFFPFVPLFPLMGAPPEFFIRSPGEDGQVEERNIFFDHPKQMTIPRSACDQDILSVRFPRIFRRSRCLSARDGAFS